MKAFIYDEKVECTAVSQCGDVYFVEINAKGIMYKRYSDDIGQLEPNPKNKVHSASISPTG